MYDSHNLPVGEPKGGVLDLYYDNGRNIPIAEAQKDPSLRGCDAAIVMNKSIDWIRKQAAAEQPFMACIWFHNVHTPLGKNPELMAQYSDCDAQEQVYFSNVTAIDIQVGRLREELRKLGIADNTMLWFASDNGPNLKGRKLVKSAAAQDGKFTYTPIGSTGAYRGWKRHLHEGGVRVPGILEWPNRIKTGRITDYPAVTSDYLPTVLDALDIPLPTDRDYDGISLMPLIDGNAPASLPSAPAAVRPFSNFFSQTPLPPTHRPAPEMGQPLGTGRAKSGDHDDLSFGLCCAALTISSSSGERPRTAAASSSMSTLLASSPSIPTSALSASQARIRTAP